MNHDKLRMAAPLSHQPIFLRATLLIPILLVVLLLVFAKDASVSFKYRKAEKLAAEGEYRQAATVFASIKKDYYKDTEGWEHYCKARIELEKGHARNAKLEMDRAFFHHLDDETAAQMDAFRKELDAMQPAGSAP